MSPIVTAVIALIALALAGVAADASGLAAFARRHRWLFIAAGVGLSFVGWAALLASIFSSNPWAHGVGLVTAGVGVFVAMLPWNVWRKGPKPK